MKQRTCRRLQSRGLLLAGCLVLGFLFVNGTPALAAPSITASPNPVGVAAGQTTGKTTITWDAAGAVGFVWMLVDGGEETQLAGNVSKGSIEINVTLGKSYEFRLSNASKDQIFASVKVTVVVLPSTVRGPLKNSRNATLDLNVKRTFEGFVFGQKPVELRCRGKANWNIEVNGAHIIFMTFDRAALPVDPAGRNLAPGQCGWSDRAMRADEADLVYQASDKTTGDVWKVDLTVSASDRFPKYEVVRNYLSDPDHYWSFFVRDIGRDEYWAEYSRRWIPIKPSTIKKGPRITAP